MWADNETPDDLIGFRVHADLLRAVVTDPKMLPLTIGVFGDWGGGKTSIMRMLEKDLNPANHAEGSPERSRFESVAVIYINTWLFEGYDDAKAALLGSVLQALIEHQRFGAVIRDHAKALLRSVDWMRAARLATQYVAMPLVAGLATGGLGALPAIGMAMAISAAGTVKERLNEPAKDGEEASQKGPADEAMDVRTFRERFGKMLKDARIKTLVVLVDDLDRCTPDRIIDNLEAVKLFLSVEQTAFVIGADRRVVEHAIRYRYASRASDGGGEETTRLVKDYLEKLVQVPYTLPRLSTTEIETYMTLLFCQQHLPAPQLSLCLTACEQSRSKNRYGTFGLAEVKGALGGNMAQGLTASLALCASAAPLIGEGLKGNPRQVKRFLNALLLRLKLAEVARLGSIQIDVLVKLMILEYAHHEQFLQIYQWQIRDEGFPTDLATMEDLVNGSGQQSDGNPVLDPKWSAVRKWLSLKPNLKDVDLRDYFWVSRDRLAAGFDVAMIPPIVRSVLDGLMGKHPTARRSALDTVFTLQSSERTTLLRELEKLFVRDPESAMALTAFNALESVADRDGVDAAKTLGGIFTSAPLDKVPPSVATRFITLYERKSNLQQSLAAARTALLQATGTKAGVAAQKAVKPKDPPETDGRKLGKR